MDRSRCAYGNTVVAVYVADSECPAPGLMVALIRRKDESNGGTGDRPNANGVAGHTGERFPATPRWSG
jgi:hypothetical protein